MRRLLVFVAASLGFAAVPMPASATTTEEDAVVCEGCEALLEVVAAHPRREADRARDAYRHPVETLAFFRVKPGMTVVDYLPTGGWYTRMLVPYLGEDGRYIGLNPAVTPGMSEPMAKYFGGLAESFPAKAAEWDLNGAKIEAYNSDQLTDEMNGTVDRVLIFREMHNLRRLGLLRDELYRIHALLKDDGLLGIVQHRARPDAPTAYVDGNKGYLREADVIGLVEAHGFEWVGKSEINANAADTADYPDGVWTLPPSLRTKQDEERYRKIGESDRMTLLFRKRP